MYSSRYRSCNLEFELVPLHKNKHHTDDCTTILNGEWPRSKAAREHSLNKSCDQLPCCLAFRRTDNQEIVGYSQVVLVQGKQKACLFESVIIRDDLRGTGLGRKLMNATEDFAKQLGFQTAYLSTHDKQGFYSRLGYTECGPVTSLGANSGRVTDEFLQKLLGSEAVSLPAGTDGRVSTNKNSNSNTNAVKDSTGASSTPSASSSGASAATSVATYSSQSASMPQSLPTPPPPMGLPPPPPPPPPPSKAKATSDGLSRHVIRMDPNSTTWMTKAL